MLNTSKIVSFPAQSNVQYKYYFKPCFIDEEIKSKRFMICPESQSWEVIGPGWEPGVQVLNHQSPSSLNTNFSSVNLSLISVTLSDLF